IKRHGEKPRQPVLLASRVPREFRRFRPKFTPHQVHRFATLSTQRATAPPLRQSVKRNEGMNHEDAKERRPEEGIWVIQNPLPLSFLSSCLRGSSPVIQAEARPRRRRACGRSCASRCRGAGRRGTCPPWCGGGSL